jgi:hypothetical protein
VVLRHGLLELIDATILPARIFDGIQDTARVLTDVIRNLIESPEPGLDPFVLREALNKIGRLEAALGDRPTTLAGSIPFLKRLAALASGICQDDSPVGAFQRWARALGQCVADHSDDLTYLAPWAALPPPPESLWQRGSAKRIRCLDTLHDGLDRLERIPTLRQIAALKQSLLPSVDGILEDLRHTASSHPARTADSEVSRWLNDFRGALIAASQRALDRIRTLEAAAALCHELSDMDISFLFDKSRDLLSIGYNLDDHRIDSGYYDLLASEARLASFLAIAQGQLGQEHWFAMGRLERVHVRVPHAAARHAHL